MKITNEQIEKLGDELLKWVKADSGNISINSFFASKGYTKKAIENFKKSKTDFSDKYDLCTSIIEGYLLAKLENRNVSTTGIKYLLEQLCGYDRDGKEQPTIVLSQTELDRIRLRFFPKNDDKKEEQEEVED